MATSTITSFALGLFVIWLLIRNESDPIRGNQPPASVGWSTLWVVIGFFLALFGQQAAFYIQSFLFGVEAESENTRMILDMMSDNLWILLAVAVLGPIIEELVFRQAIFGHLYKKMNFFWAALISSAIFSIVHLDFSHILVYTAMGFVFSYLYVKTKRIIVPIIAHVLMNTFASLPIIFLEIMDMDLDDLEELEESLQFIIGALGALIS